MKRRNGRRAKKKRNKKALTRYIKFMMPLYDLSDGAWDDNGYWSPNSIPEEILDGMVKDYVEYEPPKDWWRVDEVRDVVQDFKDFKEIIDNENLYINPPTLIISSHTLET